MYRIEINWQVHTLLGLVKYILETRCQAHSLLPIGPGGFQSRPWDGLQAVGLGTLKARYNREIGILNKTSKALLRRSSKFAKSYYLWVFASVQGSIYCYLSLTISSWNLMPAAVFGALESLQEGALKGSSQVFVKSRAYIGSPPKKNLGDWDRKHQAPP